MDKRSEKELREHEIVKVSIRLLAGKGFLDVRMSDISKTANYSMGTIYSHFNSKEDLIMTCAYVLLLDFKKLFDGISQLSLSAVDKIIIVGQCCWLQSMDYPKLIEIINLSLMPTVWRRATTFRAEKIDNLQKSIADTLHAIVMETIGQGIGESHSLRKTEKEQIADLLTHGMWGLYVGLSSTVQSGYGSSLCRDDPNERYAHFRINYTNFLKGYGWDESTPDAAFERCLIVAEDCIDQSLWFGRSNEKA